MSSTRRAYCPRCGARLRRGQPFGSPCDPCRRAGSDLRRALPPGFYVPQSLRVALANYDFGPVFREIRGETGWSQQTLGGVVDLTQAQISAIERGTSKLAHVRLVAGVAQGLGIPGPLLGFPDTSAPDHPSDPQ